MFQNACDELHSTKEVVKELFYMNQQLV